MHVLVIGAGIIGCMYGWALAGVKHNVEHLVRPGRAHLLRNGVAMDILDRRKGHPRRFRGRYSLKATEVIAHPERYDVVVFPGHHYSVQEVLTGIVPRFPRTGFLFVTQNWSGTVEYDAVLPRSRYIFGDAKAGGSWRGDVLVGAIHSIDIGAVDAGGEELTGLIREAFETAGVPVTVQPKMLDYLWVQFALNGGLWPSLVEAGSFGALLGDGKRIRRALAALRECLALVEARGIELNAYPEVSLYRSTSRVRVTFAMAAMRLMFSFSEWAKRVSSHALSNADEVKAFYHDILRTAETMGFEMPVFGGYRPVIDAFRGGMVH